jgi:transcriptional regulator with XRE-family HTH domain
VTAPTAAAPGPQESPPVGTLLRQWRERRRLSQLDLAVQADISTRHLSFVETGRSRPSSDMILRLCEELEVPLRDRNRLLLAGGYAPAYGERPLDSPQLAAVHTTVRAVLAGQQPYPALLVDRHWNLLEANAAVPLFLDGVAGDLLRPPVNVLRLSLHPDGMAPRIANLGEWRAHLLHRLRRQASVSADLELARLYRELQALPCGQPVPRIAVPSAGDVVLPLRYRVGRQELSFLSITAVLGTPMDVTLDEMAIESFYPADPATARYLVGSGGCHS